MKIRRQDRKKVTLKKEEEERERLEVKSFYEGNLPQIKNQRWNSLSRKS
jgi:hypothetical protein